MNTKSMTLALTMALLTVFAASEASAARFPKGLSMDTPKMTFEDLKVSCQNPAKFHNQVAPMNIQISCKDIQNKWLPDSEGSLAMGTGRQITTSIVSDKYTVDEETSQLPTTDQVVTCAKYKQVSESLDTVRAVTCDELLAFHGTAAEFCASAINALRAANQQAVTAAETGQKVSLCGQGK